MPRTTHFLILLLCVAIGWFLFWPLPKDTSDFKEISNLNLIAHAGGGLPVGTYSNAKEAMDLSVQNGFHYIEVDLSVTRNGDIVLLHDWGKTYNQYFTRFPRLDALISKNTAPKLETGEAFSTKKMRYDLTPLSLEDFMTWLKETPDVAIVTDVKGNNYELLNYIRENYSQSYNRFIPQIYSFEEYQRVSQLGYEDIIFTAYRSGASFEDLNKFAQKNKLHAITIPKSRIRSHVNSLLPGLSTPVWVHTVNNLEEAEYMRRLGVAGLYTDFLIENEEQ